jgi:hypothetical protein
MRFGWIRPFPARRSRGQVSFQSPKIKLCILCLILSRPDTVFKGVNYIYFGPQYSNYITLPVIPQSAV